MTPTALILAIAVAGQGADAPRPPAEIVAHRGASRDAPENTLAAINLAWEQDADAAEFDVYLTRDRQIVAVHDKTMKRTAGVDLPVPGSTLAELRTLDVGKWKADRFAGERIPTLAEMLATVPAGKSVFIEVKCGPEIVPELDRVLTASKLPAKQTPVISFDAAVIAAVKKARPDLPAYWVVGLGGRTPPTAAALVARSRAIAADGLDLGVSDVLDADFAKAVKAAGLKLYVWTVNDEPTARRMIGLGVDGITTDRPGWLREQLAR